VPPSFTGSFTDDRNVLWIDRQKSDIVRSPVYSYEQTAKRSVARIELKPSGDANVKIDAQQGGIFFDDLLMYKNLPPAKVEELNYKSFPYKNFSIQSFTYDVDEQTPLLNLHFNMQVVGLVRLLGTRMALPVNVLQPFDSRIDLDIQNRKGEITRAFMLEDSVEITLPENYWVEVLPSKMKEKNAYGEIEIEISADADRHIFIRRKVILFKGKYENDAFEKFHDSIRRFRELEQTKIVLESKT
jgi:hypothetical protein